MQSRADQAPEETDISPVIGNASPPDPQFRYLADNKIPTPEYDAISRPAYEAEVNKNSD